MDSKSLSFDPIDSGVQITLSKKYVGKEYSFYMTCILPISFKYSDGIHPSFIIKIPDETIVLKDGNWDDKNQATNNYYFSFYLVYGNVKLVMLETPEFYQNKGFATAALDIIKDTIVEYNKYIESVSFSEAKYLRKIEYIYGEAIACGNKALKQERLVEFYKKNGFSVNYKNGPCKIKCVNG